jgi:hypothetical protein
MSRLFTIEQANALLPDLRELLVRTQEEKQRLEAMSPLVAGAKEKHVFDWGSRVGPAYVEILERFYRIVKEIENLGVLVKDFEQGLCDFPHQRQGRIVHLCWKLDEAEVAWWHEVDSGFADRQPI